VPLAKAIEMAMNGEIVDAMSVAALLKVAMLKVALQQK
jgi:shikimate kinase